MYVDGVLAGQMIQNTSYIGRGPALTALLEKSLTKTDICPEGVLQCLLSSNQLLFCMLVMSRRCFHSALTSSRSPLLCRK